MSKTSGGNGKVRLDDSGRLRSTATNAVLCRLDGGRLMLWDKIGREEIPLSFEELRQWAERLAEREHIVGLVY